MKTPLLCALILGLFAIGEKPALAAPRRCVPAGQAYAVSTITPSRYPAPVAEMRTGNGPTKEGLLLRVATAPDPIQMINPAASPIYGSGRNLVTYSETNIHCDANPNISALHSDGLRLWSYREFW
jgi:hypothetical protein